MKTEPVEMVDKNILNDEFSSLKSVIDYYNIISK